MGGVCVQQTETQKKIASLPMIILLVVQNETLNKKTRTNNYLLIITS